MGKETNFLFSIRLCAAFVHNIYLLSSNVTFCFYSLRERDNVDDFFDWFECEKVEVDCFRNTTLSIT